MEIYELADQLGKALKEDARLIELENARNAYEESETLRQWNTEYEVQQRAMQNEIAKADRDMLLIEEIQNRCDEIYRSMVKDPVYKRLAEAQEAVNRLMDQVNSRITYAITGETPCTHDCSSCGGGCHR